MRIVCKCEKCPYHDSRGYCAKRLPKIGVMGTCEVIWNENLVWPNRHVLPQELFNHFNESQESDFFIKEKINIFDAEKWTESGEEEVVSSSDEATTAAK